MKERKTPQQLWIPSGLQKSKIFAAIPAKKVPGSVDTVSKKKKRALYNASKTRSISAVPDV